MGLTVLVGSLASFGMGRMRLRKGWLLGNAVPLLTYAVPAVVSGDTFHPA